MSTVRVKKAHDGHKPGDLISVPFSKGRQLVHVGLCEYPTPVAPAAAPPSAQAAELAAARKRIEKQEQDIHELSKLLEAAEAEAAALKTQLADAKKAEKAAK